MDWSDLLMPVLQTIIAVVVPLLVGYLTVLVNKQIQRVKLQMTDEQLVFANEVVNQFVVANEQYKLSGQFKQIAKDRKIWVVEKAQAYLDQHGIYFDAEMLGDMVEQAVYDGINWNNRPIKTEAVNFNTLGS